MEHSPSGDLRLTPAQNLIEATELLYSLPGVDLGRVHVALRVHGNVVDDVEPVSYTHLTLPTILRV